MPTYRVLVAHNYYQQRGGEDSVFEAEVELLRQFGHEVETFTIHNDEVRGVGAVELARATIWSKRSYQAIAERVRAFEPQVVHFHNTLPLISPSGYYAARENRAAVVQTLHNYRLTCINGLFYRDQRVCEDCLAKPFPWPGVVHHCYRASIPASAVVAGMLWRHRRKGTWTHAVDRYIALTEFGRQKLINSGLPADKVAVKPNFMLDPGQPGRHEGGFALYVGRLSIEKGVHTLLSAWRHVGDKVPLKIVGDGPLAEDVKRESQANPQITWLGGVGGDEVREFMNDATLLVVPSSCYEGLPLTIVEAFAAGLPVLASGHGAMESLVTDGTLGLHFKVGDAKDLASQATWAMQNRQEFSRMGVDCRTEFERRYSAKENVRMLEEIYGAAIRQYGGRHI